MTIKIVAFGDSITEGTLRGKIKPTLIWTFSLERILNTWFDEKVEIINAGVGGDTTVGALNRIHKDVISRKPDITLIMFSMNDQARVKIDTFRRNLVKIISILRKNNIEPILLTPNPISKNYINTWSKGYLGFITSYKRLENYVDVIRDVSHEKDVKLIDVYDFFCRNYSLQKFIFDGIHPNEIGHSAIASFIARELLMYFGFYNFPKIELLDFIKIYEDGKHNAFTDFIEWNGNFYIAFRNATCHFDPRKAEGKIIILRSSDLYNWEKITELHVNGWDNRDPKFYTNNQTLFLLTQSWSPKLRIHKTFIFYTKDGINWEGPYDGGEYVYWRPKYFAGRFYVAAYKSWRVEKWRVDLLSSKDGVNWEFVSTIIVGDKANETELLFQDDELYAFTRKEGGDRTLVISKSNHPFKKWEHYATDIILHSPAALKVHNKIFVSGRYCIKLNNGILYKTGLFMLDGDKLRLIYDLPSYGDNAYPGMRLINERTLVMSYYSGHESLKPKEVCNIYLVIFHYTK